MTTLNQTSASSSSDVQHFIRELDNADGLQRQQARLALVAIGDTAVPALIEALSAPHENTRWEAAEALCDLHAPEAAPELVKALEDESIDVRWAAAHALIGLGRSALPSLLQALVYRFDSPWLREGAYHILHTLQANRMLHPPEAKVFSYLGGFMPTIERIPWAAEAALASLVSD